MPLNERNEWEPEKGEYTMGYVSEAQKELDRVISGKSAPAYGVDQAIRSLQDAYRQIINQQEDLIVRESCLALLEVCGVSTDKISEIVEYKK